MTFSMFDMPVDVTYRYILLFCWPINREVSLFHRYVFSVYYILGLFSANIISNIYNASLSTTIDIHVFQQLPSSSLGNIEPKLSLQMFSQPFHATFLYLGCLVLLRFSWTVWSHHFEVLVKAVTYTYLCIRGLQLYAVSAVSLFYVVCAEKWDLFCMQQHQPVLTETWLGLTG